MTACVTQRRLDTLLGNIISHPDNPKYRKVNTANKILARELFSLNGSRELMLQLGFEPWLELAADGSVLVLPATADTTKLRECQRHLIEAAEASVRASTGVAASSGVQGTFRCSQCGQLVDQRRRHGPRAETWQDEKVGGFQYRCLVCSSYALCEKCYDSRHGRHPEDHEFEIIPPEESRMKGAPMPPPAVGGKHGRRGPWG